MNEQDGVTYITLTHEFRLCVDSLSTHEYKCYMGDTIIQIPIYLNSNLAFTLPNTFLKPVPFPLQIRCDYWEMG